MKIVYVCSRGERRSPVIATYTRSYLDRLDLHGITVGYRGVKEVDEDKDLVTNESRLIKIEKVRKTEQDRDIIERIRKAKTLIHPRMAYLLLKEGEDILRVPRIEAIDFKEDLVLALDRVVGVQMPQHTKTVLEFLGERDLEIPDARYWSFGTDYQLKVDKRLCEKLRKYGEAVVNNALRNEWF
ncbi:MAG: hypothetical protein AABW89_02680 [Nanoarchaeota archaeon]